MQRQWVQGGDVATEVAYTEPDTVLMMQMYADDAGARLSAGSASIEDFLVTASIIAYHGIQCTSALEPALGQQKHTIYNRAQDTAAAAAAITSCRIFS